MDHFGALLVVLTISGEPKLVLGALDREAEAYSCMVPGSTELERAPDRVVGPTPPTAPPDRSAP